MKITPEEAEMMGRKARVLEEGFDGSVMAGRPSGLRLPELVLEHEMRQRSVRRLAIAANAGSTVIARDARKQLKIHEHYSECWRSQATLPGRSRTRRRSRSMAALWTFRPDSQREIVLAPSRSSRARSACVRR